MLTSNSKLLLNYYFMLKKYTKREIKLANTNSEKYNKLQKFIFNNLSNINVDSLVNENTRNLYSNNSNNYNKLLISTYNNHLTNNKYISNDIKEFIKTKNNNNSCVLIYNITIDNINLNVNFFIYNSITLSKEDYNYYDNKIKKVLTVFKLIKLLTNNNINNCSNNGLNITFFLTPFKRTLDLSKKTDILGANNANGGFCYGCNSHGNIIIYRTEEHFKVLCHELIHNYGVDSYIWDFINSIKLENSDSQDLYKNFIKNFNLNNEIVNLKHDIGLQECIVEFWGEFLNNALFSFFYTQECKFNNNIKFKKYLNFFDSIMNIEIIHSYLQSSKILQKNNMDYESLISIINKESNNYSEGTHIFSYYILKMILIHDYKNYINLNIVCNNNNIIFNKNKTYKNMAQFFDYICNYSINKTLIKNMNFIEEILWFLRNNVMCKQTNYIINNFKMAVIEQS